MYIGIAIGLIRVARVVENMTDPCCFLFSVYRESDQSWRWECVEQHREIWILSKRHGSLVDTCIEAFFFWEYPTLFEERQRDDPIWNMSLHHDERNIVLKVCIDNGRLVKEWLSMLHDQPYITFKAREVTCA